MAFKNRFRLNIRMKLMIVLLGISLISILLFAAVSFFQMKSLGRFSLDSSISLGDQAIADSAKALNDAASRYLIRLVEDQAALSNAMLENVRNNVDIMAAFATRIWQPHHPLKTDSAKWPVKSPDDVYDISSVHLSPEVSFESPDIKNDLLVSQSMDTLFKTISQDEPNLKMVFLATETGIGRTYPYAALPTNYDSRKRSWYKRALKTGEIGWSDLYVSAPANELMITCSKPFFGRNGNIKGVVGADITLADLNDSVISTQIGDSGYAFLIDKKGAVIARPGLTPAQSNWDISFESENLLETKDPVFRKIVEEMISGKTGIARVALEQGEKFMAYAPLKDIDWSLGVVLPVQEVMAPVMRTKKEISAATEHTRLQIHDRIGMLQIIFLGCLAIMLLIASGIALGLSQKISRPILALNAGAKEIGSGNLNHRIDVDTGDEVEDLAQAFNKMTEDLKTHIETLEKTTAAKERIESELKIAHDIQMGFLHRDFPPFPDRSEFDIFATLEPAKEVGGDLYDFFFVDDDHLCFSIGDVSGKGVPAALFMAMAKTLVKTRTTQGVLPHQVLQNVNADLLVNNEASLFVTLILGILNLKSGKLVYCNAGHNYPYIIDARGNVSEFQTVNGIPLGLMDEYPWESGQAELNQGDMLFLYTDGVTEAMDGKDEEFSEERLEKDLARLHGKPIQEVAQGVAESVKSHAKGVPQSDDITMLILEFHGEGGA